MQHVHNKCFASNIWILFPEPKNIWIHFPEPKKLLNKRSELIAKCRHRAKFKL